MKFLRKPKKGAALVEYVILTGLIAVLAIGGISGLGNNISTAFNDTSTIITQTQPDTTPDPVSSGLNLTGQLPGFPDYAYEDASCVRVIANNTIYCAGDPPTDGLATEETITMDPDDPFALGLLNNCITDSVNDLFLIRDGIMFCTFPLEPGDPLVFSRFLVMDTCIVWADGPQVSQNLFCLQPDFTIADNPIPGEAPELVWRTAGNGEVSDPSDVGKSCVYDNNVNGYVGTDIFGGEAFGPALCLD